MGAYTVGRAHRGRLQGVCCGAGSERDCTHQVREGEVDERGQSHHRLARWIVFFCHPMPCNKVLPCLLTILFGPADTWAL